MRKKASFQDIVVIGLALFAMFFGSGNLIFPPFLGREGGSEWFIGFLCFFIADIGLSILAILATIKSSDLSAQSLTKKLGHIPSIIVVTLIVLCLGPLLVIPRTAATTFEMGFSTLFPSVAYWIFGLFYFILVFIFTVRPSTVIDTIGKLLTPILVFCLLVTIVIGLLHPIGPINTIAKINTAKEGIMAGYQAMDPFAALIYIIVITNAAKNKGYTEQKDVMSVIIKSSIFASVILFIIYAGLTYLGAITSSGGFEEYNQASLVVAITQSLIGNLGVPVLTVIVFFACLTSAIGLATSSAIYFEDLTKGKISYKTALIAMLVFAYVVSNFGISTIISVSAPILTILFPVLLVVIILAFFSQYIHNNNIYIFAALFAVVVSIIEVLAGFGLPLNFIYHLPLSSFQLGWIVPAIVGGIIGNFVPNSKKEI